MLAEMRGGEHEGVVEHRAVALRGVFQALNERAQLLPVPARGFDVLRAPGDALMMDVVVDRRDLKCPQPLVAPVVTRERKLHSGDAHLIAEECRVQEIEMGLAADW